MLLACGGGKEVGLTKSTQLLSCPSRTLGLSAGMARATAGIDHAGQPEEGGAVSNAKELKSRAPADP